MADAKAGTVRLLIVDDHEVVRLGLRKLVEQSGGIRVVGEAGSVTAAIEAATRLAPDVILMDVRLPDGSGVEACRDIRAVCPAARVLFLTSFSDDAALTATILAGASGYLLKDIAGQEVIRAIETVAKGQSILDPSVTATVLNRVKATGREGQARPGEDLSPQERRVLALVADGKTNKEIATALDLSDKTVKNYLSHIFQKLRITRRSQAAAYFVKHSRD